MSHESTLYGEAQWMRSAPSSSFATVVSGLNWRMAWSHFGASLDAGPDALLPWEPLLSDLFSADNASRWRVLWLRDECFLMAPDLERRAEVLSSCAAFFGEPHRASAVCENGGFGLDFFSKLLLGLAHAGNGQAMLGLLAAGASPAPSAVGSWADIFLAAEPSKAAQATAMSDSVLQQIFGKSWTPQDGEVNDELWSALLRYPPLLDHAMRAGGRDILLSGSDEDLQALGIFDGDWVDYDKAPPSKRAVYQEMEEGHLSAIGKLVSAGWISGSSLDRRAPGLLNHSPRARAKIEEISLAAAMAESPRSAPVRRI